MGAVLNIETSNTMNGNVGRIQSAKPVRLANGGILIDMESIVLKIFSTRKSPLLIARGGNESNHRNPTRPGLFNIRN